MRAALRFGLAFVAAALPVSAAISPAIAQDANAVAAQQARLTNEQSTTSSRRSRCIRTRFWRRC